MKKKYLAPEVEDLVCLFEEEIATSPVAGGGTDTDLTISNETDEDDWAY